MSARTIAPLLAFVVASLASRPSAAQTIDGGADAANVARAVDDAGDAAAVPVALACDGSLCDTTNGGTCDVARGPGASASPSGAGGLLAIGAALAALLVARSRRCRAARPAHAGGALVAAVVALAVPSPARAEPPPAVDVAVRDAPPPRRVVAVAWNPLPLVTIGKLSADLVIAPLAHHALVLSPFWARTTTAPVYVFDDAGAARQLPEQTFTGFGGELGYRYYSHDGGLRGCFAGPSLIGGSFTAKAADGTSTSYAQYGLALDVGYEALVADRIVLGLGLGVQYLATSKSLPDQQFPANVYASSGVRPRLLVFGGWAF